LQVKQLGPIRSGEIEFAPLTVLSGGNNQGKTYFSYTLYGILTHLPNLTTGFLSDEEYTTFHTSGKITFSKAEFINKIINTISRNLEARKDLILKRVFRSESDSFNETIIKVSAQEIHSFLCLDKIKSIERTSIYVVNTVISLEVFEDNYTLLMINNELNHIVPAERIKEFVDSLITHTIRQNINTFYIPAERIGINVFKGQLNNNKIDSFDRLSKILSSDKLENSALNQSLLQDFKRVSAAYPQPIEDYLNYINNISKYEIDDQHNEIASLIRSNLINGRFVVDPNTNKSYYRSQIGKNRYKTDRIPMHNTSSSIKSLYGLDYFFENIDYTKQNTLIIDEPEMNLHPSNQIEFANVLNLVISKGIHVVISTHSDILVKKIQNIILDNEVNGNPNGLNSHNVKVYNFKEAGIHEIDLLNDDEAYDNFNDPVADIEEEYLDLLEKRALKRKTEVGGEP